MLRVKRKGFLESIFSRMGPADAADADLRSNHNPLRLWAALLVCTLPIGIFNRIGTVFSLSLIVYAVLVFWRTSAMARSIRIIRTAPDRATEKDFIQVEYEIMNLSAFTVTHYAMFDRFSGSKASKILVEGNQPIQKASSVPFKFRRKCDAGMGMKEFGPMIFVVTDPLGLFEFQVIDDRLVEIEIFPKLEILPEIPLMGSKDSFLYGLYDVPVRGSSVNFMGIRDYTLGDSLRHISWRLSAKQNKLLVKEFEKVVNTDVSLVLNMDGREHMGQHSESTWEFMKDIALALITQQMAAGNGVQLLSNKAFVPIGRGAAHAHEVSTKIFDLRPNVDLNETPPLRRFREFVPRGSTVIYLSPVFSPKIEEEIDLLKVYRVEGVLVRCILLDAATFIAGKLHWKNKSHVEGEIHKAKSRIQKVIRELAIAGIPTHIIGLTPSLGKELLKPAVAESPGGTA